ncbi:MAG: C4-type zinc ribbon domain-containing protein [Clostridiales bacterium]|nr:C4-type zinc ribbon domain-containing protein [Clostridiales bacterium]
MSKLSALLEYQETDVKCQQIEAVVRKTENRIKLSRLHKQLKEQQATIAKQTEDAEAVGAVLAKLTAQLAASEKRLKLESSEMENLAQDEESTAEELTEFRKDIEKLNREFAMTEREAKAAVATLEKLIAAYKTTRSSAGKAKKEYDLVRAACEKEREESAEQIAAAAAEMDKKAAQVDKAMLGKYGKARQHFAIPVVPIAVQKCSGCNMSLPMIMMRQLTGADTIAECENCGRLLYVQAP